MKTRSTITTLFAALAAGLLPAAAQAQYYGQTYAQPAPLYPYVVQTQPNAYIVQPVQNGYVVQQQAAPRAYPYVRGQRSAEPDVMADYRRHQRNDRALIEELRKRTPIKKTVVNTEQVIRDPPVVIEKKRVVQDPPVVIERRHYVEDAPAKQPRRNRAAVAEGDGSVADKSTPPTLEKTRVIRAEAEVTILGPDRMSIRLFRKGHGTDANARAE
jgi:hypothetical protein